MNSILFPVLALGGTGLAMGVFLAYASKKFEVKVDEKVEMIQSILPGANCGACGFPGCAGYADAIALHGAGMTFCAPGGAAVAKEIAKIMGATVDVSDEKKVARVLCQGDNLKTKKKYDFNGDIKTCAAIKNYAGGDKSCNYSCLGYGDCERVCPTNAIKVNERGIAEVDESKCISCEMCVKVCPKSVITMISPKQKVTVMCSSKDKGVVAKAACQTSCIGCSLCAKTCPVGAIVIENNLARIIEEKCVNCGACALKCPTKAIIK